MKNANQIVSSEPSNSSDIYLSKNVPLIHLFEAYGYNFVLDLHTNRLFLISPIESNLFYKWQSGEDLEYLSKDYPKEVKEIKELKDQGLFSYEYPQELAFGLDWNGIVNHILHRRGKTIIEITQKCNLRCKYCTFGGGFDGHRTHSSMTMSEDLLKKTISSALEHGDQLDEICIGFYGGEPLIEFDLLKRGVTFAQEMADKKKLRFTMTTNATLIDKAKAEFLRDAGFSVLVSIDGPQYMHDKFRVFPNGKGSYSSTIEGLKILLDIYPLEFHNRIGLNMVVPLDEWTNKLEELWDSEPWLSKNIRAQANLMEVPNGLELHSPKNICPESPKQKWIRHVEDGTKGKTTLETNTFDKSFAILHQRSIYPGFRKTIFPNGCCIPGARKIYVGVNGTYQICERAHGAPTIGSVEDGVDLLKIKEIIKEYSQLSYQDCRSCFAMSLCNLCFQDAYVCGKFNIDRKREICSSMKKSIDSNLKIYGKISQERTYKLDEWDKVDIS